MDLALFALNDNLIEVLGLKDEVADTYANSATVQVTLKDSSGQEIAGETWPLALAYVTGSNGDYRGLLQDALGLSVGDLVTAVIDVDAGAGLKAHWEIEIPVETRTR